MKRKLIRKLTIARTGRTGIVIENGKFGIFFGFWFLTVDIIGGYHLEIG